jgi:hypothetical protein
MDRKVKEDIYQDLNDVVVKTKTKDDTRKYYFEFLNDFKTYLTEFVRETVVDLSISDIKVDSTPQKVSFGEYGGMYVILKNQGEIACFLTTDRRGAFRLDPGEKEKFWLNRETTIMTISGATTVGFIRT